VSSLGANHEPKAAALPVSRSAEGDLASIVSVRCASDDWRFRLRRRLHCALRLVKRGCARAVRRPVHRHENRYQHKKQNDQHIDFLRAVSFRSPKRIEIVFIQTHKFPPLKLSVSSGRKYFGLIAEIFPQEL
jgi:hypothetical protein